MSKSRVAKPGGVGILSFAVARGLAAAARTRAAREARMGEGLPGFHAGAGRGAVGLPKARLFVAQGFRAMDGRGVLVSGLLLEQHARFKRLGAELWSSLAS